MRLKAMPPRLATLPAAIGAAMEGGEVRHTPNRDKLYGRRWRKARAAFLALNRYCALCRAKGRRSRASVVDHIEPHRGDPVKFWDENNWQPLCDRCHNSDKQRRERAAFG